MRLSEIIKKTVFAGTIIAALARPAYSLECKEGDKKSDRDKITLVDGDRTIYQERHNGKVVKESWEEPGKPPLTIEYSYDTEGNITAEYLDEDGNGKWDRVRHFSRFKKKDGFGRLRDIIEESIDRTGDGRIDGTKLHYFENGRLVKQEDLNQKGESIETIWYKHDSQGRIKVKDVLSGRDFERTEYTWKGKERTEYVTKERF